MTRPAFVMPAKAGIQGKRRSDGLDSRFRGNDTMGEQLRLR